MTATISGSPRPRDRRARRRPGLRRRRGRGGRQGWARVPRRPPQDRPGGLGVLQVRGPAPQEEAGRRRGPRRCSWPTPTGSSTPPAGPPSTPSASSPRPGIQLAGAITAGAARGLEIDTIGDALAARYGLNFAALRYLGMGLAGLAVLGSTLVLLGLPVRWMLRPVHLAAPDAIFGRRKPASQVPALSLDRGAGTQLDGSPTRSRSSQRHPANLRTAWPWPTSSPTSARQAGRVRRQGAPVEFTDREPTRMVHAWTLDSRRSPDVPFAMSSPTPTKSTIYRKDRRTGRSSRWPRSPRDPS